MNRSTDAFDGAVWSNSKVSQREDGKFEVTFPNAPDVPAGVADNLSTAIERAKQNFRETDGKGKIGK
jgi:hypothetical protein